MDAPRRERRHHHRKAAAATGAGAAAAGGGAAAAAVARAAYGDVFGGPPRFGGAPPLDYAEVFGGVAAACSIPYLDLPPVAVGGDGGGSEDYREIFGRFDFGDFAVPYEELFGEPERGAEEEIASSSGSSRSSIKKESRQVDAKPSTLHQRFKEHESSPISFPSDSQEFVMSYYKTTQARPDNLVEMTTCTVDPSMDYVLGSGSFSHIPATNHASKIECGIMANGDKGKKSPSTSVTANVRSPESDSIVDQKQRIPACSPLSENVSANENNQKSDSHAMPSNGKPSADYAFMRVSDVKMQPQPEVPVPPLGEQPKVLNKRDSAEKGDAHLANHSCAPTSVDATLSTNMPQAEKSADSALSNTEANPGSAAAAMKEAMEYAEARLRAAKELMERKGDSFKIRKKPSHHRSTRSTEFKAPLEVDTFEEKLSVKKAAKEEKNTENFVLDKRKNISAVRLDHSDGSGNAVLPLEKPQQMVQPCTVPCVTSSKLEKLGNWRSGDEFYELTGDDQKCKTHTDTGEEDDCERSKPVTKSSKGQKGTEVTAADSDLDEKLWEVNDGRDVGLKHVNQREENTVSIKTDRVSIILEASTENMAHKEIHNSHFEGLVTVGSSKETHDDVGSVELPSTSEIFSEPDFIKDVPSSFSVACLSANDLRDLGNGSVRGNSVAGTSKEPTNSKGGLETACDDEMQCASGSSEKLQEPPGVANVGDSQASQIKSLILEELEGSYVSQASPRVQSTAELEMETYGREKFSFIDESVLHNENDEIIELPCEAPISEVEKVEAEVVPCAHSEESVRDQDAECPEESDITSQNNDLVDHEESTVFNVFEVASKLIKRDLDQGIQGSLGPGEMENRTEEGTDGLVSNCKGKEADKIPSENSEKTGTEEGSAHGNQEDQTASETDANKGQNCVDARDNITIEEMGTVICSGDEVTIKIANDCPTRLTINTKDGPASCPEMCTGVQHLSQNAESAASQTFNESAPGVDKTEEVCKEAERELPTDRSTTFEEEKSGVNKMEGKDSRERISKAEQKHQKSHLEKSGSLPKSAERAIPVSAEVSRKEVHGIQRTKEIGSITKTEREREKDKEASRRLEEAKEREKRFEKERENTEYSERKKLEEERAREREKDKLAVERATREAHERAFAEACEKAEKMALERIVAARQRASAEARQKEERASAEARIKAERAAVERATAEARERAIEKAKAEKAAAEAREQRERYRSSSKESFKSTNLDMRQDTQFQRATSSSFVRNPDSCSKVVEAESALRHKARIERHQRTTERVTKALAEKNMRDLMAQREQAEKHRLADFLDPEVKRWSNGKEGNLRALLSTLQYILGADSGWQPVPLTDLITAAAVRKAYRKATLCVHPDKLQQRGATIRQKYICEKVFDLLKDAWNKFTSEER